MSIIQKLRDSKEELISLIEKGYSEKELSEHFGCSLGMIMYAKKTMGLLSKDIRKEDPKNRKRRKKEFCVSCGKKSNKTHCFNCTQKRSMIAIKQILVEENGGKCSRCGYDKCQAALDFHHLDPKEKEMNIAMSHSIKNIDKKREECKKCVLLCSNCHREEHWKDNEEFIEKNKEKIQQTKKNILKMNGKRGGPIDPKN